MSLTAELEDRQKELDKALSKHVGLDYGLSLFDEHASGMKLSKESSSVLREAAEVLKSFPAWTVVLEGHCPGRPEENNIIRESVGEEAADLCKNYLQKAGVANNILCEGRGSSQGLGGMCVRMSAVAPKVLPGTDEAAVKPSDSAEEPAVTAPAQDTTGDPLEDLIKATGVDVPLEEAAASVGEKVGDATATAAGGAAAATAVAASEGTAAAAGGAAAAGEATATGEAAAAETAAAVAGGAAAVAAVAAVGASEHEKKEDKEAAPPTDETATQPPVQDEEAAKPADGKATEAAVQDETPVVAAAEQAAPEKKEEAPAADDKPTEPPSEKPAEPMERPPEKPSEAAADQEDTSTKAALPVAVEAGAAASLEAAASVGETVADATAAAAGGAAAATTAAAVAASEGTAAAAVGAAAAGEAAATAGGAAAAATTAAVVAGGAAAVGAVAAVGVHEHHKKEDKEAHAKIGGTETLAIDAQPPDVDGAPDLQRCETDGSGLHHEETQPDIFQPDMKARAETTTSLSDRIDRIEQHSEDHGVEILSPTKADAAPKEDPAPSLAETMSPAKGSAAMGSEASSPSRPGFHRAETAGAGLLSRQSLDRGDIGVDPDEIAIPDTSQMSMEEKAKLLDDLMDKVLETNIAFEPNKAEVHRRGMRTVRQLAKVMLNFPSFTVRCVGHSKGRPADNNDAKKQLAQARAEAVKAALAKEGVTNDILCASCGSALGRGMCVRLHVLSPEEMEDAEYNVPRTDKLTREQQEASLNQLLKEALDRGLAFEPNKASIQPDGASVIKQVHGILRGFPDWMIRCEGHAKGLPADNNDAKQQLSQVRAEAVRAALEALGTTNPIYCQGLGSTHGLGMCVRMFAMDPDKDIEIPNMAGRSEEERSKKLDSLLEQVLERNIEFEPNKSEIPTSASATINSLARVLKAFPDFTIRCEGNTKGLPADNNEAKRKLSHARAESVKAAVKAAGVNNKISCIGVGSSQGRGMCVRMFVIDPAELKKDEITVPEHASMPQEEQKTLLNELLETALQKNIDFEPNVYEIPATGMDTIHAIAEVLKQFPDFAIRCEGHAKGQPADNTEAKKKLSHMRAEAVKAAVIQEGAANSIHCIGEGCSKGLGMRVRMFVIDPEELKKDELQVPDTSGMEKETRRKLLDELLSKALEKNISFEPNKAHIQASGIDVVKSIARVLAAFPDFAVRCEGHAKGKPADNNEAKIKLSQVRAEAVATALSKEGAQNKIVCAGKGCAQGLGMCVRMFAMEDGDSGESKPDA